MASISFGDIAVRPISFTILTATLLSCLVLADNAEARKRERLITRDKNGYLTINDTTAKEDAASRSGIFVQIGFFVIRGLNKDETFEYTNNKVGVPISIGLYNSVDKSVRYGLDFTYVIVPGLYLWGAHEQWSILDFGVFINYNLTPYSKIGFYCKPELKLACARYSQDPGTGFFGDSVGTYIRANTGFVPSYELAIGLAGNPSRKKVAFYAEMVIEYIPLEGKIVHGESETAGMVYSSDLWSIGGRVGFRAPF